MFRIQKQFIIWKIIHYKKKKIKIVMSQKFMRKYEVFIFQKAQKSFSNPWCFCWTLWNLIRDFSLITRQCGRFGEPVYTRLVWLLIWTFALSNTAFHSSKAARERISQIFFIRMRSIPCASQFITVIFWYLSYTFVQREVSMHALSCWKIQLKPPNSSLNDNKCSLTISWYSYEFCLPCRKQRDLYPL